MRQPDVVLIHPPSVFDFRERAIFYGPVSDVIPSSPVFEMYPIGFLTLAAYLRRHGYRVRIVNLALLMMRSRRFDVASFLRGLHPRLFGIDLHWLPHAHGGSRLAELLAELHPGIPVVFGGISATYFHHELVGQRGVDFVLRGAQTECSLLALLQQLEGERRFDRVPGLTWKDDSGVRVNADSTALLSPDELGIDLGTMVAGVVSHLDFWTSVPFHSWWRHPITAVFTVKGCARGCVTCGASRPAFSRFMPGCFPLRMSPAAIAQQVSELAAMTRAPIFLVGDLRDGGSHYGQEVLAELSRRPVSNRLVFEFFHPPERGFIDMIDASVPNWGAELSPETHDESIRLRLGKARFTNAVMESAIDALLASRCSGVDLFYMIGLPGQTYDSVLETTDAIERLFARTDRRLSAFITPMGPFIDPGSEGFERAEAHGYHLRARTLAEHRALLEQNDWEAILNYETDWMTRREIVDATYDAAERLNDLKLRYGRIGSKTAAGVGQRIARARKLRRRLSTESATPELAREVREASEGVVNDKAELFAPGALLRNFRIGGIVRLLLRGLRASYLTRRTGRGANRAVKNRSVGGS